MTLCDTLACALGFFLRIGVPVLVLFGLGWLLGRNYEKRNGKPNREIKGEKKMSIGYLRTWVWIGTLLAGGTLTLILNRIFPHTGWIFLFSALYFVSGCVLDGTVRTYEPWEREYFTRKYGRWFPFLIGLGGPFYLAWEFFANLWRYS